MQLPKILLVEDDHNIAGTLVQALHSSYDIDIAAAGRLAVYKITNGNYDLIVLDLNLPDISGLAICQQLRDKGFSMPILILTGEDSVLTKINLLDAGANDYLTKPFSLGELKARLRVLLRSSKKFSLLVGSQLSAYGLTLDRQTLKVSRDGQAIKLRRKEFALLECLLEHAGSVVSRTYLNRCAWQGEELWTNTVDVHIKNLRDKIDKPFEQPLIHTVHGLGYKLDGSQVRLKLGLAV
ncbi:MAG TPA: response regulator transcription factor [Candidatus Saccharimonadales bacterium]|jgi:DNA-binding response OmpR family regulator|nr:response regulator transcription factor [Candidatus Saccharimonadales bacterium]